MIKNFLASEVGLRKETVTFNHNVYAGQVVQFTIGGELGGTTKYGVVYNDVELNGKETLVASVVTAGHIIKDKVDLSGLEPSESFQSDCALQGLFVEPYKPAKYPNATTGTMENYVVETPEFPEEEQGGGGEEEAPHEFEGE